MRPSSPNDEPPPKQTQRRKVAGLCTGGGGSHAYQEALRDGESCCLSRRYQIAQAVTGSRSVTWTETTKKLRRAQLQAPDESAAKLLPAALMTVSDAAANTAFSLNGFLTFPVAPPRGRTRQFSACSAGCVLSRTRTTRWTRSKMSMSGGAGRRRSFKLVTVATRTWLVTR